MSEPVRGPAALLMRIPVPWVFVLTYLVGVMLEAAFPIGMPVAEAGRVGGIVLAVGVVIAGWGLILFRKARTTTIPGRASNELITSGPYQFSRNPMYVGLSIAYLGEAGLLRQTWPILLLPLTLAYLNWIVIPVEEGRLREVFGNAYQEYCSRVRRWL